MWFWHLLRKWNTNFPFVDSYKLIGRAKSPTDGHDCFSNLSTKPYSKTINWIGTGDIEVSKIGFCLQKSHTLMKESVNESQWNIGYSLSLWDKNLRCLVGKASQKMPSLNLHLSRTSSEMREFMGSLGLRSSLQFESRSMNPYQNTNDIFHRTKTNDSKICSWNTKYPK